MLTEQEWNALDDEAPEKQYANYLDYKDAVTKKEGKTPVNAISNQGKGANLTDKEREAAIRLGISSENNGIPNLDADGLVTGPGGIRYDPYKEHIVIDPLTGGPMKVHIGAKDPQTNQPYTSYEEMAKAASENEHWAKVSQDFLKDSGGVYKNSVNSKGQSVPTTPENKSNDSDDNKDPNEPNKGSSFADYITSENEKGGSGIRDYLIADALATFARNTGKDIGNVAAAYSGGTMNNNRETSLLEKRNAQKAQAETEEQIAKEYANSRLGQELRDRGLDIGTKEGRIKLANNVKAALYDEKGNLKYEAGSPTYNDLVSLYNQLSQGYSSKDSILSGLGRLVNRGISDLW